MGTDAQQDVVTPIIHMNGDRAETLTSNLWHAWKALRAAQAALRECSPNGRNYYPEPGRFERALEQHKQRVMLLKDVADSLSAEVIAIRDRESKKRRER